MKRVLVWVLATILLFGCTKVDQDLKEALELRRKLQAGNGCSFDAVITADYGDMVCSFTMHCVMDQDRQMQFEVLKPETISGISGKISGEKGMITFDEQVLAFDTLADDYITPVVSPWVMVNALISGYITSSGEVEGGHRITLNDSFDEDALEMDVWIDGESRPIRCEILYKERRVLSLDVSNFTFL